MPGLAVLHPIHFLPLTPPSSDAPSPIATIDSFSLSDCELLQRRPSLSIPLLSPLDAISFPENPFPFSSVPPELGESAASNAFVPAHDLHAIPAPHHSCTTPPPLHAMHPPLTSTQRSHFSSYRFRIRQTPKSTLSFKVAAPAPRIPLAAVLQYWGANDVHPRQDPGPSFAHADVRMDVDVGERVYEESFRRPGLGLVLGLTPSPGPQSRPYPDPHAHPHPHSQSQSQSRSLYSRRLRRLAPAPLELTPPTRNRALLTPAASPLASAPAPANPRRTPVSGVFVDTPLATCPGPSRTFDLDRLPAIPSVDTQPKSPFVSPETDRIAGPSLSSAKATMSTAPTSLVFPSGDSENHIDDAYTQAPTDATVDTWYVNMITWRRTVSRALDSPFSPFRSPKSAKRSIHTTSVKPVTTPLRSAGEVLGNLSQLTPGLPRDTAPPPPPRMECNPLPELAESHPPQSPPPQPVSAGEEEQPVYPQHADLTWELDAESLMLWAEKCSETIARASLDPGAIAALCDDLRRAFATVQRALERTPRDFVMDGSEARQTWYTNHCDAVHSLSRNMQHFHMLARRVEDRPPRIHRLEGVLQKLATYQAKFTDVARRLEVSHEKLRLLDLRTELARAHTRARVDAVEERRRRREDRAMRQEGRIRRHALREEIRRVRGTIRTMRDAAPRHAREREHEHDENVFYCGVDRDGDQCMGEPCGGGSSAKWRSGGP
ncbi:hypothetical protein V8D89_008455 [Ganoderma adspersum]